MKQSIQILPEHLCNKIAAGEVVERPASVVKELLENSLDAGAREIRVEVEGGGKRLVRVVDDGTGMGQDDAFLCLERHATSKIRSDDDLFSLRTLGFRGEALPSIAAVSRLTLRSRSAESLEGWEIYAEGGTVKRAGEVGIPVGTTMEVRDLFFNTPARRKFLRRDETEIGHIADIVTRLALAHHEVQFSLVHNGRPLIEAYRQNRLSERVGALLGRPLLGDLIPLERDGGEGLRLHGLVGHPGVSRSTTGAVYTFINGRYIRDRVVQHALLEGYRNLLEKGRYPVVILFLEIDPALVDVNVHPTKHEVRFQDQKLIHDFIVVAVRDILRPSGWLPVREGGAKESLAGPRPLPPPTVGSSPAPLERIQDSLQVYARTPAFTSAAEPRHLPGPFRVSAPQQAPEDKGFFSSLEILGQYRRSYVLCQDGDDLILIDQHAAHERIGFERLKSQYSQGRVEGQSLLFPAIIQLDFRESAALAGHLDDLARLGFDLEPFGGNAWVLKGVPRILSDGAAERLVRDVAGEVAALGKSGLVEEALDDILILMACHGMLRANQSLAHPEIEALLRDLDQVDFSAHCPHGRPVMKRMTLGEIERMFKRG